MQNRPLHLVLAALVTARWPTLVTRHREHRRVLAGAVVVDTARMLTTLTKDLRPAGRRRIVWAAGEVAFFESEVTQHLLYDRDMLGLATVRAARYRELFIAPPKGVEPAGAKEWDYLKRLRAGSPVRERIRVAGDAKQLVVGSDNRCMHSMFGFDLIAAGDSDIELVRLYHIFQAELMGTQNSLT